MTPLATSVAGPRSGTATASRREQLIATLEALIYHDDVDLDLFQPGVPWPQARDITQQTPTPVQAPSPEERGNIQSDYHHAPTVDTAMEDATSYSQLYADPFHLFDTQPDGVMGKSSNSWFSQVHDIGFESSATNVPSYSAPLPPTPPHRHGHDDGRHGLTTSHYTQINTSHHGDFSQYDFSGPLNSPPPTSQPPEVAYPSISKSSNLPLFDFMSWDMFMDYGAGESPAGANDTKANESTNSADDFYDDRQSSASPRTRENQEGVQPPPTDATITTRHASKRRRHQSHRSGLKCASPTPPPCRRASQASVKSCPPRGAERAHSAIEKKYRAGINEKFEALRGCIESRRRPKQESLEQALRPGSKGEGSESGGATTAGTTTSGKKGGPGGNGDAANTRMNKAEVLSEAAEYIQQLEDENGVMLDQLKVLVQRLRATRMALQPVKPVSSATPAA